jgi:hypothetical protein
VISGIEPALPPDAHRADDGVADGGAMPQPEIVEKPREHVALTLPAPRNLPPIGRELAGVNDAGIRRVAAASTRPSPCRAEELGVIERFLAERGATRCPDLTTIQQAPLPTLVWDKIKRKWVRPSAASCQAN